MNWAKPRARRSTLPPTSNGTRMVTGRRGHVSALAGRMEAVANAAAVPVRRFLRFISDDPSLPACAREGARRSLT